MAHFPFAEREGGVYLLFGQSSRSTPLGAAGGGISKDPTEEDCGNMEMMGEPGKMKLLHGLLRTPIGWSGVAVECIELHIHWNPFKRFPQTTVTLQVMQ